jgi:O-antigen/teichoic acid export membrane protein
MTTPWRRHGAVLAGSGVIAVAMGLMNVSTYGFTILAARVLGPAEYGALAAVAGLLLILNVVSLGLQATGARRVAAAPEHRVVIEREVLRTTYLAAAGLGLLALLAAPAVSSWLKLDSWSVAALIAVTVVPLTVMGGQSGILQGERRWSPLAVIYLAVGLGRLAFGCAALALRPDTFGAMTGVALGAFVPAVAGWWALRHPRRTTDERVGSVAAEPVPPARRSVLTESVHNSHALLAFFALSNIDVVVARAVLDEHDAGLYAGGLILTKAVLFLPQFVVVVVFPAMSGAGSARRTNVLALVLVGAIGLTTVLGVTLLSGLAVTFIGGPEYAEVESLLWGFALLGTVLALLQLMVYNLVARQQQRAVVLIWLALGVVAAGGAVADSVSSLLITVASTDAVLLAVLVARAGLRGPIASPTGRDPHAAPL